MKIVFLFLLFIFMISPVFAVCPLNGVCTGGSSPINPDNLQNRYIPDNIDNLSPQNNLQQPNKTNILNNELERENISPESIYQNCQFGECFPKK